MSTPRAALVLHYGPYNSAALNVLLGALEPRAAELGLALHLARGREALLRLLERDCAAVERVLVAWSFYSPEAARASRDLAWLRRRVARPGLAHVAGGAHASAEPAAVLASGFDLAALGEGEHTIRALAEALVAGTELACVAGCAALRSGAPVSNGRGARVAALDEFPPFAPRHRRFNAIELTRGCVYACSFCQTPYLFQARFRHRSVASVVHWVGYMRSLGCNYVRFLSPTAFSYGAREREVDLGALEELLSGVRAALGSAGRIFFGTFPSEVRPEHVTPEALALVRRFASNTQLVIGGQSGSERVLSATHRGHGVEDVRRAVRIAREAGFVPNVDFLFGLPGETAQAADETLRFAREISDLGARIHAHSFMPLPGTPLSGARAGRLAARTQTALEELAGRGAAYGQWRAQQSVARALARSRARKVGCSSPSARSAAESPPCPES